ncbi:MAG: hypothetical protein HRT66_05395 [Flavobacteriaceae bacterium]|nr:hypothetical protein [Flavobacteriaceae bacterium]
MKTSKKTYILLLFFCISHIVRAQVSFEVGNTFTDTSFDDYIDVYNTTDDIDPMILVNNNSIIWQKSKVLYGFSNDFYWLRFTLKNISDNPRNLYLEIDNHRIRYIEFYQLKNGSLLLESKCGRYMPFDSRPIDNEKFVFPINLAQNSSAEYYVKIDKRSTSVSFPVFLWDQNEFNKENNKKNLLNGILFGSYFPIALYSSLVFIRLRRILYLWYALYVISIGLCIFTSIGYSFQYINNGYTEFNSVFKAMTIVLALVFHIKFIQKLVKTNIHMKKIHLTLNIFICLLLLLVIGNFIIPSLYASYSIVYLNTLNTLILSTIFIFLLIALLAYKKQKKTIKLYFLSFVFMMIGCLLSIAFEYGLLSNLKTRVSPLFIGSLSEIIILSILLIGKISKIDQDKKKLSIKIIEKQQEVVQAYTDGIEKEKLRISEELHDNIGSQLANLSRSIGSKGELPDSTQKKLVAIIDDVRRISHKLAPVKGALLSFEEQLKNLIEEAFIDEKTQCKHHIFGEYEDLNEKQKLNIYRVLQEFLHNILKHADATVVEIQIINLEDELTLTIEDNGIGFRTSDKNNGLGLQNIQRRVDYMNGTMEISSILKQGTFIVISIPFDRI